MQEDALTVQKRDSYQIFKQIAPTYDLLNRPALFLVLIELGTKKL